MSNRQIAGLKCPACGQRFDKVVDSRVDATGTFVRRRRECMSCEHRYTTYEVVGDGHHGPPSLELIADAFHEGLVEIRNTVRKLAEKIEPYGTKQNKKEPKQG